MDRGNLRIEQSKKMAGHRSDSQSAEPPLAAGDWVEVGGMAGAGRILEIEARRKRARVLLNDQEWLVELCRLARTSPPHQPKNLPNLIRVFGGSAAVHELDLHGERVEEALLKVDAALDRAVVHRLTSIKIIHGHGTGRVRTAVRELLGRHPHVAQFRFGSPMEGGLACTVVELRQARP